MNKIENVTAVIKTFLRDDYLYACVRSLRETYPDIKIIVGDGGRPSQTKRDYVESLGGEYYELPFDCGIAVGRNTLVGKVKTDFVLIGDDDFYYEQESNLEAMLTLLEISDVAGGGVRQDGKLLGYQGFMRIEGDHLQYQRLLLDAWENHKGLRYKPCDLTFNFFIGKRDVLLAAGWDENIKVAYEHSDFFLTLKELGYKVVFTPHSIVTHKPDFINISEEVRNEYKRYRMRREDKERFFNKRHLKTMTDMWGYTDSL